MRYEVCVAGTRSCYVPMVTQSIVMPYKPIYSKKDRSLSLLLILREKTGDKLYLLILSWTIWIFFNYSIMSPWGHLSLYSGC